MADFLRHIRTVFKIGVMLEPRDNVKRRKSVATHTPRPRQLRIAVRLWDWSDWCRQVMRGIQSYAHSKPDWRLYIVSGANEAGGLLHRRQNWDGMLTHVLGEVAAVRGLIRYAHTRVVSFSARPPRALKDIPAVRVNDDAVAMAIGNHFLAGGFRQFAYYGIRGPVRCIDYRAAAILKFARSVDCPCQMTEGGLGAAPTMSALVKWVRRLPKPVGLFAWNMPQARTIVQACQRVGISVPDQVAVVAWDDDAVLAESIEPTITGAVLPAERLGQEAARLLDRLLAGEKPPSETLLVEPTGLLHIRKSSDAETIPDRPVYLAEQFIREHAADTLAVSDVAKYLRISRRSLENHFKRVNGKTVNAAIMTAHIQRARQLLLETNWPLHRVAKRAGFGTSRHFHRIFLQQEGKTPKQYRAVFSGKSPATT